MVTATFDTHQAVKAIIGSGLDDTQAEAIVTTINKAMNQGLATKSDIKEVKSDIVALKADVVTLKVDMKSQNADLLVLKWMVGLVIAVEVIPFLKFFA